MGWGALWDPEFVLRNIWTAPYLNLTQAKREKIKQQNLVKRQNQMKLAKMDLEFKVFKNLAGYLAMQENDNTKKNTRVQQLLPVLV